MCGLRTGRGGDMTHIIQPTEGSFYKYLRYSGDFVTTIASAIQRADPTNLARLEAAFPQMVAAFRHQNWNEAPPGFAPHYQAEWVPEEEGAAQDAQAS